MSFYLYRIDVLSFYERFMPPPPNCPKLYHSDERTYGRDGKNRKVKKSKYVL